MWAETTLGESLPEILTLHIFKVHQDSVDFIREQMKSRIYSHEFVIENTTSGIAITSNSWRRVAGKPTLRKDLLSQSLDR